MLIAIGDFAVMESTHECCQPFGRCDRHFALLDSCAEMFRWEHPRTRAAFGTTAEFAAQTRVLAANQGLYNGFLAAGLVWALWLGVAGEGRAVALFFLGCVLIAGISGALTASRRILFVQAIPAALALIAAISRF